MRALGKDEKQYIGNNGAPRQRWLQQDFAHTSVAVPFIISTTSSCLCVLAAENNSGTIYITNNSSLSIIAKQKIKKKGR